MLEIEIPALLKANHPLTRLKGLELIGFEL